MEIRLTVFVGAKFSSSCKPLDITKYARVAPHKNSGTAMPTNASEYRRSLRCKPGVTNAHNWYSHTGEAITMPASNATLKCHKIGSKTLLKTSGPAPHP